MLPILPYLGYHIAQAQSQNLSPEKAGQWAYIYGWVLMNPKYTA